MPTTITDPFGNVMEVCSISTMMKAQLPKLSWVSEAEWMQDVKKGAFYTLRQKIDNGEIIKNTVIGRTPIGHKLVYKGDGYMELSKVGVQSKGMWKLEGFEDTSMFKSNDWDFGPNMAQMAKQAQAIVDSPAKLAKWLKEDPDAMDLDLGDAVATLKNTETGKQWDVKFDGLGPDGEVKYVLKGPNTNLPWTQDEMKAFSDLDQFKIEYKVGQTPPLPAAAKLPPVASTSKSVGALTNEEAATMFVKTKDKLALEKGINIKGASGKLDELVYKTIADQAGYTPAEMLAKVEAYKGSGKKLSALKKKVLPKNGNPTKTPTAKAVDNAVQAVKKEEIKPEEVVQVWDDEAVAKAYIKAKDHVVATNDKGWTLYTKNPDFDAEIHKWMQADLGPIKKDVADTAVANYIATKQKLSVLKKQMIKKGELNPQADTLKKKKSGGSTADEVGDGKVGGSTAEKAAPKETGAGQVGKTTEDPKVIGPKQQLTTVEKEEIKTAWENANLPLSSSGQKIYDFAKKLSTNYGHGDDVLPVLRWVDEYKAQKFGVANGNLYEKKIVDWLKNPQPAYTPPKTYSGSFAGAAPKAPPKTVFSAGELPADSELFEAINADKMTELANNSMKRPSSTQQGALKSYSGSYYKEINGHLRAGGSMTTRGKQIQDSMSPLPENIIVRRGTRLRGLGMETMEELEGAVGKTFIEPGFSSTAVGSGQFANEIGLVIQAPKGTQAVWLKPYSMYSHENELLLAARTKFQILKVEKVQDGVATRTVVTVRVVP